MAWSTALIPITRLHAAVAALTTAILIGFSASAAFAATFVVDRTDDPSSGGTACTAAANDCSLRGAISAANAAASDDTIQLSVAGTYTLALTTADDANAGGDLDITSPTFPFSYTTTIVNTSGGRVTISQSVTDRRVFDVFDRAKLDISDVTITGGNLTTTSGDGSNGGGIQVRAGGQLKAERVTVTGNSIGSAPNGSGGGIHSAGPTELRTVTISGNSAPFGGGINHNSQFSSTHFFLVFSSTITNNTSTSALPASLKGAVQRGFGSGQILFRNTIVAGNIGPNCMIANGSITSIGDPSNLSNTTECGTTFLSGSGGLGALANNGGLTDSHAIVDGAGGALDTGDDNCCAAGDLPSPDQRGITRPQGTRSDIGAYERRPIDVTTSGGTTSFSEGDPPVVVDGGVTVANPEGNVSSAEISVSAGFVSGSDELQFTDTPNIIGSWNSASGTLTLSGSDTAANYQAALRTVKYTNLSDAPIVGARTIAFQVLDNAIVDSANKSVNVSAVNDAPTISVPSQTIDQDTPTILSGIAVVDPDALIGVIQVQFQITAGGGTLSMPVPSGGSLSGSGTANLTATGALADVNAALAQLTLSPASGSTATVTLKGDVDDQGNSPTPAKTGTATGSITIRPPNIGPTLTAVTSQTANENTTATYLGTSVADPDAGTGNMTMTFQCSHCKLDVPQPAGGSRSNNNTANVTISGTLAAINAALLPGYKYTPNPGYTGPDTVVITINDNGNTGPGGAKSDSKNVSVTVVGVNDPPVNVIKALNGPLSADESGLITNLPAQLVQITDPDAGGTFRVTIGVNVGTLTLVIKTGLTFLNGTDGTDDPTIVFTGTRQAINTALGSLRIRVPAGREGPIGFSMTTNDQGNGGPGPLEDTDDVDIMVVLTNDSPVNSVPTTSPVARLQVKRNTPFTMSAGNNALISVADPDAGASPVRVQLVVGLGRISLASTAGLTFEQGDGVLDATMRFRGSLADVNAALNGMVYTPNANALGDTALTVATNDLGNTGVGGAKQDQDSVYLKIIP
jgi:hypothetical protein